MDVSIQLQRGRRIREHALRMTKRKWELQLVLAQARLHDANTEHDTQKAQNMIDWCQSHIDPIDVELVALRLGGD